MFNIRFLILILFLIGIIIITVGITRTTYQCPPHQIKYIYVPRTFEEQQNDPIPVSDIFQKMFDEPSPWVSAFTTTSETEIEDGFVSQA